MKYSAYSFAVILFMCISCSSGEKIRLTDPSATPATIELWKKISETTKRGILIGHQDATAYGIGWKYEENKTTCDIQMVCGDYPGIYGWELGDIEHDSVCNLDSVNFAVMRKLISDAHKRGGLITISWHSDNPVTGESAWSERPTIQFILENPENKAKFISWLDWVAYFLNSLKDENGNAIPVVFRPWHEWTGGWFWWGAPHCTNQEFIDLWKLTVETLRDKNHVHNVLYAFTCGTINNKNEFLERYPGDEYVDIIGFDTYMYGDDVEGYKKTLSDNLLMFREMASAHKKLFALTETGYQGIPSTNWFSEVLFPVIKDSGISWVLFWRNFSTKHHYGPYPGHMSADDFKKFHDFPETLFEKDISINFK